MEVPPRFELGLLDSKSSVIGLYTTGPVGSQQSDDAEAWCRPDTYHWWMCGRRWRGHAGGGKQSSTEAGFILCGRRRKHLDAPRYRRVRRLQKANEAGRCGLKSSSWGSGQISGSKGRTLTISAGRTLRWKIIRKTVREKNSVNSGRRKDKVMVGMPSIRAGHTNQFTGDGSFWSPDVSASCGA